MLKVTRGKEGIVLHAMSISPCKRSSYWACCMQRSLCSKPVPYLWDSYHRYVCSSDHPGMCMHVYTQFCHGILWIYAYIYIYIYIYTHTYGYIHAIYVCIHIRTYTQIRMQGKMHWWKYFVRNTYVTMHEGMHIHTSVTFAYSVLACMPTYACMLLHTCVHTMCTCIKIHTCVHMYSMSCVSSVCAYPYMHEYLCVHS
jgi:hypothetical protein